MKAALIQDYATAVEIAEVARLKENELAIKPAGISHAEA